MPGHLLAVLTDEIFIQYTIYISIPLKLYQVHTLFIDKQRLTRPNIPVAFAPASALLPQYLDSEKVKRSNLPLTGAAGLGNASSSRTGWQVQARVDVLGQMCNLI